LKYHLNFSAAQTFVLIGYAYSVPKNRSENPFSNFSK